MPPQSATVADEGRQPWLALYPPRVPPHLDYPSQPLGWLLERTAKAYPERIGCQYYAQQLTYAELHAAARSLADTLRAEGLQPGDHVGVLLPNIPETIITLFGVWMAGGVVVSLSPLMVAEEVSGLVKSTECRFAVTLDVLSPLLAHGEYQPELVLIASLASRLTRLEQLGYAWVRLQRLGLSGNCLSTRTREFEEAVEAGNSDALPHAAGPHDPAFILPTSGTTSAPKAVVLSHGNLMANAWQLANWTADEVEHETILSVLPFFHSYGLSTCMTCGVALGATLLLHHRFRPASVVRLIETHRPTLFPAVPAMLAMMNETVLRKKSHDLTSIKAVISGGSPLPRRVAEEFSAHTGCPVVEGYGLSEASPVTHVNPLDGTDVPGAIGIPLPDTDARIVDAADGETDLPDGQVGELIVRGPQVMLGYYKNQAETDRVLRDGWLYTGDLGTRDERGFFRIVDRKKDLIITSGFNVYPTDVEQILRTYPGVKDAAVIGVPDDITGELVKAILVVEDVSDFQQRDFDHFAKEKLAAHKRPRLVELRRDDLPRNFLGKVLRKDLRSDPGAPAVAPAAG